jgi:hypothetical protein
LPTKFQLQAESISTALLTSLTLASFPSEVKRTFTNFLTAHHNLESSRATPSRLRCFTSRVTNTIKIVSQSSNAQVLTKRILSTHHLVFLINHKILTKKVDESSQRVRMSLFCGWHQLPSKEGGGSFYNYP